MNSISYGQVDLWSREAMIYYLLILVLGTIVTSHVIEAACVILNRPQDLERRAARARLKRSTHRYKELSRGQAQARRHEPRPDGRPEERAQEARPTSEEHYAEAVASDRGGRRQTAA